MPRTPVALRDIVATLAGHYPPPVPLTDPMAMIVWETCAYLVDEDRRRASFEAFESRMGFDAAAIAQAPTETLLALAALGGPYAELRVKRQQAIAHAVADEMDNDLTRALTRLPKPKARALLKGFPSIGDLAADKILLFSGAHLQAAVDSNGLRALARLGVTPGDAAYAKTYRIAVEALTEAGNGDRAWLVQAFGLLREHGRLLCKRSAPICLPCPLDVVCAHQPIGVM